MPVQLQLTYDDFDGDSFTNSVRCLDEADFASRAAMITALDSLMNNINLWTAGRTHRISHNIVMADAGSGAASTPIAQGALQLILETEDTLTGGIYRERIPMPDLAKAVDAGLEVAWLTDVDSTGNSIAYANPLHADYITLKAAMEAAYISPEGNTAILTRLYVPNKM